MIKCIVVDDEKIMLNDICNLITETGKVKIQGAYKSPYDALDFIKGSSPDVVFLDIEMPGLTGIDLARKIANYNSDTQIVFVTAYEQYALKAFEVSAVHYLLKPLTQEKINEAVNRVIKVKQMDAPKGKVENPQFINSQTGVVDRISVKNNDNIIIIKISDIIYLKSENRKISIVTKDGSYQSWAGLLFWEDKLKDYRFIRCHRSYIVNMNYIKKIIHILGEYKELTLDYCDINIPISRQKISVIKDCLGII